MVLLNELFMPNVFVYGICLFIMVTFLSGVGWLSFRWMSEWNSRDNAFLTLFNTMAIGLTMVIPLFAIIWTRGNSIMWIAVLLWVGYIVRFRKSQIKHDTGRAKLDWAAMLIAFVMLLGVYVLFYYLFFVRSGGSLCGDHVFYANASCIMKQKHVETASFASLFRIPAPYHYGELWLTVLCSSVFGLKPLYALLLIAYPFFCFLLVLGMAALCKEVAKLTSVVAMILGVTFMFFVPLVSLVIPWVRLPFVSPKGFIVLVFMVWGALMLLKKDFPRTFVTLCFLIPFYSTVAPGILTFVFFLSIALKYKEIHSWNCCWNKYALYSIGLALLFGGFYLVQEKSPIEEPIRFLYEGNWVMNALLFAAKRIARYLILLLPTILVLLYYKLKKKQSVDTESLVLVCVVLSCIVSCLVGGFLKETSRDGGQVTTNYVDNLILVLCFGIMVFVIFRIAERIKTVPSSVFAFLFMLYPMTLGKSIFVDNNNYPKGNFCQSIEDSGLMEFEGKEAEFASFKVYLDENGEINWHSAFGIMPHVLKSGYFAPYDLSELDLPEDFPVVQDDSRGHAFWQYVYLQKKDGVFVSKEQSMLDFVKDMGIEYVIVNRGAELPHVFDDKIALTASYDGDVIYRIVG